MRMRLVKRAIKQFCLNLILYYQSKLTTTFILTNGNNTFSNKVCAQVHSANSFHKLELQLYQLTETELYYTHTVVCYVMFICMQYRRIVWAGNVMLS